jgi:hypothetical protein
LPRFSKSIDLKRRFTENVYLPINILGFVKTFLTVQVAHRRSMLTTLPIWKIVVQLLVVSCLMIYWTLRPDPLRRILQIGITAEVLYGMIQDQVSARLCPEYFTVAHPRIEGLTDPTLLGITWGFLGSWWGGAILGAVAGFTARLGKRPQLHPRDFILPIVLVLAGQAVITMAAGWYAAYEVTEPGFAIIEPLASHIPQERHKACFIVSRMHQGTYMSAIAGGILLCVWITWRRCREVKFEHSKEIESASCPEIP